MLKIFFAFNLNFTKGCSINLYDISENTKEKTSKIGMLLYDIPIVQRLKVNIPQCQRYKEQDIDPIRANGFDASNEYILCSLFRSNTNAPALNTINTVEINEND